MGPPASLGLLLLTPSHTAALLVSSPTVSHVEPLLAFVFICVLPVSYFLDDGIMTITFKK